MIEWCMYVVCSGRKLSVCVLRCEYSAPPPPPSCVGKVQCCCSAAAAAAEEEARQGEARRGDGRVSYITAQSFAAAGAGVHCISATTCPTSLLL